MALKAGYTGIKKLSEQFNLTTEGTLSLNVENDPDAGGSLPISGDAAKILAERDAATRQLIDDTVGWESVNLLAISKYNQNSDVDIASVSDVDNSLSASSSSSAGVLKYYNIFDDLSETTKIKVKANILSYSGTFQFGIRKKSDNSTLEYVTVDGTGNVAYELNNASDSNYFFIRLGSNSAVSLKEIIIYRDIYEGDFVPYHASVEECKADNTTIAPVENGTTVQNPSGYAVGSHAIRNGAFITWKNAKAQGETITDSDYDSGDVADVLCAVKQDATTSNVDVTLNTTYKVAIRYGKIVDFKVRFTLANAVAEGSNTTLFTLPFLPNVLNGTFTQVYQLINSALPYNIIGVGGVISKTTGDFIINADLAAGNYEVGGTYICK